MLARTLIQHANLFPHCRSEFPCYVGDIQPLTAYPTIPLEISDQQQGRLAGIAAWHLLLELVHGTDLYGARGTTIL